MTTTCLQNILVLSAGQTMQPDARGQAIQAPTVTLLVDPGAGRDSDPGRQRRPAFNWCCGIRATQTIEKTPGRYVTELYNGHRPEPPKAEAAPRPRPKVVAQAAPPPPAPAPLRLRLRPTRWW